MFSYQCLWFVFSIYIYIYIYIYIWGMKHLFDVFIIRFGRAMFQFSRNLMACLFMLIYCHYAGLFSKVRRFKSSKKTSSNLFVWQKINEYKISWPTYHFDILWILITWPWNKNMTITNIWHIYTQTLAYTHSCKFVVLRVRETRVQSRVKLDQTLKKCYFHVALLTSAW